MELYIIIIGLGLVSILTLILIALSDIDKNLKTINKTIIDIHPNYKYKKVYESERYKQKL